MKKLLVLTLSLFLTTQCFAATGWLKSKPAASDNPGTISTTVGENNAALDLMLSNFTNCKISYDTAAQLTVSAGGVMVSNSARTTRLMLANTAATSVTFTDIDTGTEAASTTYYVYAIASATTDTVFTVKISASSSAPTGVTYYKRLGSFYNDSSSNITQIVNDNDDLNYLKGQGNSYKVDSGTTSVAGGYGSSAVSFSFTFATAPIVLISSNITSNEHGSLSATSITTTGFTANNNYAGTATGYWIAIGQI